MPSRVIESSQETPADLAPNGNGAAAPDALAPNTPAADDLDAMLAQFERETAARPPQSQTNDFPYRPVEGLNLDLERAQLNSAYDLFNHQVTEHDARMKQERDQADIRQLISDVRGEQDAKRFPDSMVDMWLSDKGNNEQAIKDAWLNRYENPQAWNRAQAKLQTDFARWARPVAEYDPAISDDIAAVAAAVRGARGDGPPADQEPNFSQMSDQEFRQWQRDHGYSSVA